MANLGGFHPSFNPEGSGKLNGKFWYEAGNNGTLEGFTAGEEWISTSITNGTLVGFGAADKWVETSAGSGMYRINFAGNGWMEIPAWYAQAGDTITMDVVRAAAATMTISDGATSSTRSYVLILNGNWSVANCLIKVDGVPVATGTAAPAVGTSFSLEVYDIVHPITVIGGNFQGNYRFSGSITNLTFTSSVAGNSRDYSDILTSATLPTTDVVVDTLSVQDQWRVNYAASGYMEIPTWVAGEGDTITFNFNYSGGITGLISSSTIPTSYLTIPISGKLTWNITDVENVKLDGVLIATRTIVIEPNREYSIELSLLSSIDRVGIYPNWSGFAGSITNLRMNSTTTGNSRSYADIITSVDQPTTLSVVDTDFTPISSTKDCFLRATGGTITSGVSGRPSNDPIQFADAIYATDVQDLRLSAHKQDVNRLRVDAARNSVAATIRGKGKVPFTHWISDTLAGTGTNPSSYSWQISSGGFLIYMDNSLADLAVGDRIRVVDLTAGINVSGDIIGILAGAWVNLGFNIESTGAVYPVGYAPKSNNVVVIKESLLSPEYDEISWTDIIGSPANIAATFPDGCVGMWIPHTTVGSAPRLLNRKAIPSTVVRTYTTDIGATWTSINSAINNTGNTITFTLGSTVNLIQYPTLSAFTQPSDNGVVVGDVGDVVIGSRYYSDIGNRLQGSLTGNIGTSTSGGGCFTTTPYQYHIIAEELHGGVPVMHNAYSLYGNASTSAFKTLTTITEIDGLLYEQYHGRELVWDTTASDWGDATSSIPVGNGDFTYTDSNGTVVKAFCHVSQFPLGIASYSDSAQSN